LKTSTVLAIKTKLNLTEEQKSLLEEEASFFHKTLLTTALKILHDAIKNSRTKTKTKTKIKKVNLNGLLQKIRSELEQKTSKIDAIDLCLREIRCIFFAYKSKLRYDPKTSLPKNLDLDSLRVTIIPNPTIRLTPGESKNTFNFKLNSSFTLKDSTYSICCAPVHTEQLERHQSNISNVSFYRVKTTWYAVFALHIQTTVRKAQKYPLILITSNRIYYKSLAKTIAMVVAINKSGEFFLFTIPSKQYKHLLSTTKNAWFKNDKLKKKKLIKITSWFMHTTSSVVVKFIKLVLKHQNMQDSSPRILIDNSQKSSRTFNQKLKYKLSLAGFSFKEIKLPQNIQDYVCFKCFARHTIYFDKNLHMYVCRVCNVKIDPSWYKIRMLLHSEKEDRFLKLRRISNGDSINQLKLMIKTQFSRLKQRQAKNS